MTNTNSRSRRDEQEEKKPNLTFMVIWEAIIFGALFLAWWMH